MGVLLPGVDVLRVTVVRGHRRVDVSVAAGVPVAELLPELERTLRADGEVCALATVLGEPFDPGLGLGPQGVRDGQLLTLLAGGEAVDRRHDDLAAVVRDVGADELCRWGPEHVRSAVWLVLVTVGVVAALLVPAGSRGVAAGVGTLYVAGATTVLALSLRGGRVTAHAWAVAAVAAWHVVLLGGAITPSGAGAWSWGPGQAPAVTAAGAALVLWGIALLFSLPRAREWSVVPLAAGVGLVIVGMVATLLEVRLGSVAWMTATVVLLAQRWVPLALVDAFLVPDAPRVVERSGVSQDLGVVHRLLTGLAVAVTLGCVVVTPYAVVSGPWGQAWVAAVCLVLLLRMRHQSLRDHVAVAVGGALGVASVVAWVSGLASSADIVLVGCVAVGVVAWLFVAPPSVRPSGVRWGWWGDQVERVAVAVLVPLCLLGTGIVPSPLGWFG